MSEFRIPELNEVVILLFITPSFKQLFLLSSDKQKDTNINTRFGQVHNSGPKWKLSDSMGVDHYVDLDLKVAVDDNAPCPDMVGL